MCVTFKKAIKRMRGVCSNGNLFSLHCTVIMFWRLNLRSPNDFRCLLDFLNLRLCAPLCIMCFLAHSRVPLALTHASIIVFMLGLITCIFDRRMAAIFISFQQGLSRSTFPSPVFSTCIDHFLLTIFSLLIRSSTLGNQTRVFPYS